jgi:flagellin
MAFASATPAVTYINVAIWDTAIGMLGEMRSAFGAVQNRLEHAMNFMSVQEEQLMAAESRIRDVDVASEMASLTQSQIRQQAATAMLAQANTSSSVVLDLLP